MNCAIPLYNQSLLRNIKISLLYGQYLIFSIPWLDSLRERKGLVILLRIIAYSSLIFFPTKGNVANHTILLISFN